MVGLIVSGITIFFVIGLTLYLLVLVQQLRVNQQIYLYCISLSQDKELIKKYHFFHNKYMKWKPSIKSPLKKWEKEYEKY